MYLRIFTLNIYDVYVSSFCLLYVFSDKFITYYSVKKCTLFNERVNKRLLYCLF